MRSFLTGLTIPQEYCCLELEQLDSPLKVILTTRDKSVGKDVTTSHVFLGYKPLIIGLITNDKMWLQNDDGVCLSFVHGTYKADTIWKEFPSDSAAVARVMLKKIQSREFDSLLIYLFEASFAEHKLIGKFHQAVNNLRERFRIRSKDNVGLPGNLYEQVRIAYSIPRKISIITVGDVPLINMFPTDLHGPLGNSHYASSLRIGGNANAQVESLKRVVLSEVNASSYLEVYSMGKNHMMDLQHESRFMLHPRRSRIFNLPLPEWALRYREMMHIESFDHGIHRIHFYQVLHSEELENSGPTLAHIQQYYAQWRMDQGLRTTLNLRKE